MVVGSRAKSRIQSHCADPRRLGGSAQATGRFVDYDSVGVDKNAAMGLVWIDTNHQLAESNETNNCSNAKLIGCK